jgi:hypothetical protein
MHKKIGERFFEDGTRAQLYYATHYRSGALFQLPWGNQLFDCVIIVLEDSLLQKNIEDICNSVVVANTDWVQTTGARAEWLHDQVDIASVKVGRQRQVGDGSPMTAWDEEALKPMEMAEVLYTSLGGVEYVLALVIGNKKQFDNFVKIAKKTIRRNQVC